MSAEGEEGSTETMLALKGELAALQFKRDRLLAELSDMRTQVRCKDEKTQEIENQAEKLQEQLVRQNAVVATLRQRVQELEVREQTLVTAHARTEAAYEAAQREIKVSEDRLKQLGCRVRELESECHEEAQGRRTVRSAFTDHLRHLATALDDPEPIDGHMSQDCLLHKANDLVHAVSHIQSRSVTLGDELKSVQVELRSCREALERAVADRDNFQRQAANSLMALDRLRQEKDELEIQKRMCERDMMDLREKVSSISKELTNVKTNYAAQEAYIQQLRDECNVKDEKATRHHHLLESLAVTLSTPLKFVESSEERVKARIRDLIEESKEKCHDIEEFKEKIQLLTNQLDRQTHMNDEVDHKIRVLGEEKALFQARIGKLEEDLHNTEVARENLRRDKKTFMSFMESLGQILGVEDLSKDSGVELQTESLLIRAEQLVRLETEKVVDKLLCHPHHPNSCLANLPCIPGLSKFQHEKVNDDLFAKETSAVYQLQRRVRTLKEQLQRKELHLDLLRRKLNQQEENCRVRSALANERDETAMKNKKLSKQVAALQGQLNDARSLAQELRQQLTEAADFKISALEKSRKIEELQQRLVDSELLRTRYNKKIQLLKEQVLTVNQTAEQDRTLAEHSMQMLRDDLSNAKIMLAEATRRENQLLALRTSVIKILGIAAATSDFDILGKLEKIVAAHREFTMLSRRYEESVPDTSPGPSRTPRFDDQGYIESADLEDNEVYHKHAHRHS